MLAYRFQRSPKAMSPKIEDEGAAVLATSMKAWHSPDFKNLTFNNVEDDEEMEDSWLPCCNGGFFEMNELDKKGRKVQGVFDCTCAKT